MIHTFELLQHALPQVIAGYTDRQGGTWTLPVVTARQVHGTAVARIDAIPSISLEGYDALITDVLGIAIGVRTADCIPILLADPIHHAIAAIHSGWRGTVQNIVGQTLQALQMHYGTTACDVLAAIGPGIGLSAFEVGDEVYEAFMQAGFPADIAQHFPSGKWHLDLKKAVQGQLIQQGVHSNNIEISPLCTYTEEAYFSARREGIGTGRMLSVIGWQSIP